MSEGRDRRGDGDRRDAPEPQGQLHAGEPDAAAVGRRVRRRRRALGLSQAELAGRAGVSRQAVGALEGGHHLPRVDAAVAIARALGTTVEDLLAVGPPRALHVLGHELADGQAVRVGRVGDHTVCLPLPDSGDGELWSAPDGVVHGEHVQVLPDGEVEAFVLAGCDPAIGLLAALGPRTGAGRILPVPASSGAARFALTVGRAHAAVVHDVVPADPADLDRVRRLPLAAWRTGLAAPAGSATSLADALRGAGPVVQRDAGAGAQLAYERALDRAGAARPPGPVVHGHLDAARHAVALGRVAVTIEPVARALGLDFHPLETHRVEVWVDAGALDHPGAAVLAELLASPRLRSRLATLPAYQLEVA